MTEYGDPERGTSVDSTESRWVFQEDEDDAFEVEEYEADLRHHHSVLDFDDKDNDNGRVVILVMVFFVFGGAEIEGGEIYE
ncbi:hypothetical protein PIB30_024984 [Stylosanthes scabra]|uniref:Uncharacterized protein n=1 Tax=Stylosanthes scabra TaxID=79078 RepID=A0ABU6Y882_9FABA|nr:hypothetical protein [Stylosanthes scabra]